MAKFNVELPNDLLKELKNLEINTEKMMGEMTKTGAEIVYRKVLKNAPKSFQGSNIMKCLKITKIYRQKAMTV